MPLAGDTIRIGQVPGGRIATETDGIGSATFTTSETQIMSIEAPLVGGRRYSVSFRSRFESDNAGDLVLVKIREDDLSGNEISRGQFEIASTSGNGHGPFPLHTEHTADATESKTFVVTAERSSGSGNVHMDANSFSPAFLYVDYISG